MVSHAEDDDSLPPRLSIDESLFSYVDINEKPDDNEKSDVNEQLSVNEQLDVNEQLNVNKQPDIDNKSKSSIGIDQEQYQNQILYQNLLNNQDYYLN